MLLQLLLLLRPWQRKERWALCLLVCASRCLTSINEHGAGSLERPASEQLSAGLAAHGGYVEVPELHGLLHEAVKVRGADPLRLPSWLLWLVQANVIITLVVGQHNNKVWALPCRKRWDACA